MDAELPFGCRVIALVLSQIDIRVAAHPTIFDEVAGDIAVINPVVVPGAAGIDMHVVFTIAVMAIVVRLTALEIVIGVITASRNDGHSRIGQR